MATMKTKSVGFNVDDEKERLLYEWAASQPNFSEYVRQLMRQDILNRQKARQVPSQSGGINIRL